MWTYLGLDGAEWKATSLTTFMRKEVKHNLLWLRIVLPRGEWNDPTLFLPRVFMTLEVYLENELIYSYGELEKDPANRFASFAPHRIFLPPDSPGKNLFIQIYSDFPTFNGIEGQIKFGSREQLLVHLFKGELLEFLVGLFCIFVGLFALVLCLDRTVRVNLAPLNFGIFSLAIGFAFLALIPPLGLVFHAPVFWYYTLFLSFYIFPVGLIAFVEQFIGPGYKKILRRLWQFQLLLLFAAIAMEAAGWSMALWMGGIQYVWIFECVAILAVSVYRAIKGSFEARVFTIGVFFFSVFAIHDILNKASRGRMMTLGTFIFIVLLGYILFHRGTENTRRLRIYSRDLEEKTAKLEEARDQLEEYSRTLEDKVEARTREVKEKQAQLVQSSKMAALGSLVAGVAHEINTPVGAISSMHNTLIRAVEKLKNDVDICLRENKREQERIKTTLRVVDDANQVIRSGTERVIDIVKRLRSFARLDEAELKDADIHEGLEDTLTIIHHQIKDKITLVKEYGDIPKISCFPGRLNQVFLNLLINAKQAMKDGGEIHISTFLENGMVHIRIKDTGEGIAPENLAKIFDPGFTTKGVGVGTGLGLSICYQIVQDHLGEIRVESEPRKGTAFTIVLPIDLEERLEERGHDPAL